MKPFRETNPKRTFKETKNNYRDYKQYLAKDFNHRCGYTDCSDIWFGGKNNFHIDHFRPWKGDPNEEQLKIDYQNLVYCCSYVNILKSDDRGPYSDPCDVDFNTLFFRDDFGMIYPFKGSESARYMYYRMRLYMARYGLIWLLDNLKQRMQRIAQLIIEGVEEPGLSQLLSDLVLCYTKYEKYLSDVL